VELQHKDYRALARVRYLIRHFLQFSEEAARSEGLEAQQHQMMLAIRASDENDGPTIGQIAEQLFVRHHSAVGLVDRLEARGLVQRTKHDDDRRQVHLRLTARGATLLEHLSQSHQSELRKLGPELVTALSGILKEVAAR
jgi:DNA-binding MarR family transcriptional regulator